MAEEVERWFLRLVSIPSERGEELEKFCRERLVGLLTRLGPGSSAAERRAGTELLGHLSKRLRANEELLLPVPELLAALRQPQGLNVDLAVLYLRMGFPRAPQAQQRSLLPGLLETLDALPAAHSETLLPVAVRALLGLAALPRPKWPSIPFHSLPKLRAQVLQLMADIALAPPARVEDEEDAVPPGLSRAAWLRLRSFTTSMAALEKAKKDTYKWLLASEIPAAEWGHVLVLGQLDPIQGAALEAETKWRQVGAKAVLDSPAVIVKMAEVFLGSVGQAGVPDNQQRSPAELRLRQGLMGLLVRSDAAAGLFPLNIKVLFEALFGKQDTGWKPRNPLMALLAGPNVGALGIVRLQTLACRLADNMIKACPEANVRTFVPIIFTGLKSLLEKTGDAGLARAAFASLAQAGLRAPHLLTADLSLLQTLFEDATKENEQTSASVLDCLSAWLPIVRDLDSASKTMLRAIVDTYIAHENPGVQHTALKYLEVLAPPSDVPSRWHILLAAGSKRQDVRKEAQRMLAAVPKPAFQPLLAHLHSLIAKDTPLPSVVEAVRLARTSLKAHQKRAEEEPSKKALEQFTEIALGLCRRAEVEESLEVLGWLLSEFPDAAGPVLRQEETKAWLEGLAQEGRSVSLTTAAAKILARLPPTIEDLTTEVESLAKRLEALGPEDSWGWVLVGGCLVGEAKRRLPSPGEAVSQLEWELARRVRPERPLVPTEAAVVAVSSALDGAKPLLSQDRLKTLIEALSTLAGSTKDAVKAKLRMLAIGALGKLQLGDKEVAKTVVETLLKIGEGPPQASLQLTVGEALVGLAERGGDLPGLVDTIAARHLKSERRQVREAGVVWLVALVEKHGRVLGLGGGIVREALVEAVRQGSELAEEAAGRGLRLLFLQAQTEQEKAEVVSALINSYLYKPENRSTVTGAMASFAHELGKPELVFHLLCVGQRATSAEVEEEREAALAALQPHRELLVPRLYRQRFEVEPSVAAAMRLVWAGLAEGRKGLVEEHGAAILADLEAKATSGDWRVRESACMGLADLISGHASTAMKERLGPLWEILLKVADDMKESVRVAALRALQKLSRLSLSLGKREEGGPATVRLLLDIVLERGLKSRGEEVRIVSLELIQNLCRDAGKGMAEEAEAVVRALLESLSDLEPALLNYIAVRSANESEMERVDGARMAAARSSPSMDALSSLVPHLEPRHIRSLGPLLGQLIKSSSAGLPARTGAAAFLRTLASAAPREVAEAGHPWADRLLKALENGLTDRNTSIRKQMASTLGLFAKFASSDGLGELLGRLRSAYLEDEASRLGVASALASIADQNQDLLKELGGDLAPLAYLALQTTGSEADKTLAELWEQVWAQLVPSTTSGLRTYQRDVVAFAIDLLANSAVYAVRVHAATAIKSLCQALGKDLEPQLCQTLASALLTALGGRTWDGKAAVLGALQSLITDCLRPDQLTSEDRAKLSAALLKECARKSVAYKLAAAECAGVASGRLGAPEYGGLADVLEEWVRDGEAGAKEDEGWEDWSESERRTKVLELEVGGAKALGASLRLRPSTPSPEELSRWAGLVRERLGPAYWRVGLALAEVSGALGEAWGWEGLGAAGPELLTALVEEAEAKRARAEALETGLRRAVLRVAPARAEGPLGERVRSLAGAWTAAASVADDDYARLQALLKP